MNVYVQNSCCTICIKTPALNISINIGNVGTESAAFMWLNLVRVNLLVLDISGNLIICHLVRFILSICVLNPQAVVFASKPQILNQYSFIMLVFHSIPFVLFMSSKHIVLSYTATCCFPFLKFLLTLCHLLSLFPFLHVPHLP